MAWIRRLLDQYRIEHFQLTTEEVVTGDYTFEKGVYLLEASHQESGEEDTGTGQASFYLEKRSGGTVGRAAHVLLEQRWLLAVRSIGYEGVFTW